MIRKNMKKAGAVLMAAGLILSVTGCSGKTVDKITSIQEAGVLKVAIVNSDSSFTRLEGKTPVGMEPELIDTISAALGVTTDFQVMGSNEAIQAVSTGTADVAIGCINSSAVLAENYLMSTPYGKGFFYVVTEKGDYAQSPGAFSNSVIGVNSKMDNESREQLYRSEGITVNEYGSYEAAVSDIKDGRIRAYICYENDAKALLADKELQVQNLFDAESEDYVIITGKDAYNFMNGINVMIQQFLVKE